MGHEKRTVVECCPLVVWFSKTCALFQTLLNEDVVKVDSVTATTDVEITAWICFDGTKKYIIKWEKKEKPAF